MPCSPQSRGQTKEARRKGEVGGGKGQKELEGEVKEKRISDVKVKEVRERKIGGMVSSIQSRV